MKKAIAKLGTVLTLSALLAGCQADNAAYNRPNAPRDVNYRTGYNNPNSNAVPPTAPDYNNLSGDTNNQVNQLSYGDQKKLANRIADRAASVDGVDEAHVLVSGNNVAIGAVLDKGRNDRANLRKKIRLAVLPLAGGREVLVSTDSRYVKRITATEATFNAGKATREVRSDIVGIIDDLANAVKRPFENNSK
ncbi:YhcN/YlaJ family sporulation lipoprotein [Sporolactobacillus shoreicorticis]|uniref:YhcN/YlaJ family sporulation lipoprotein n=1 Tax=Sporolactobacillus shoreicorticis TaxID=1923877 RepID=A0ABW5S4B1_9BACL|nr:YhcN/YlaJ family sporulation lipoprotein [Sporolactobacillus shoreicorticis]MCO7126416.1 YhcN/YlaJ family sporulation lipoprotein [Sporolactobacillus shoreicorticis]